MGPGLVSNYILRDLVELNRVSNLVNYFSAGRNYEYFITAATLHFVFLHSMVTK